MKKIRKGDKVLVRIGKDKGKQGVVLKVLPRDRVLVENINVVKRHTRPNPGRNITGGILQKEAPIHVSNVMLFNAATSKGERTGIKMLEDGRKVRVFRRSGEVADV
jgi:large subunit ribosomal protein L24